MIAVVAVVLAAAEAFVVKPDVGNSNFNAVFDAPLGERITAMSPKLTCDVVLDEAGAVSGTCKVPLATVNVDNITVKTEHFQQWAINKGGKKAIKACQFEASFKGIKLDLQAEKETKFSGDATFTICGRGRDDKAVEKLEGTAVLLPAGSYGDDKTIRIRARVPKFNRESYQIGPKWTEGWLARVQQLASVVAAEGEVNISLFARSTGAPKTAAK